MSQLRSMLSMAAPSLHDPADEVPREQDARRRSLPQRWHVDEPGGQRLLVASKVDRSLPGLTVVDRPELDRVARPALPEPEQIGGGDGGDLGVAAGRLAIGEEHDRLPVAGNL